MSIKVNIIADSVSTEGIRLTSFEVQFHRFILPEVNTHRALSRNYRSSRAVPVAKLLEEVRETPAIPVRFGKNQPGMQANQELTGPDHAYARRVWELGARAAADTAEQLMSAGVAKEISNRPLEPYLWAKGVISATDWNNFFALRRAPDAQPEFKVLADAMFYAMQASKPKLLLPGEWHLPYVLPEELARYGRELTDPVGGLRKLSVARVARVSVKPFDGTDIDIIKDIALHDRLLTMKHMSPFEHVATPDNWGQGPTYSLHGNFTNWIQYRKTLPNEYVPG